jgi:hypothetical protein
MPLAWKKKNKVEPAAVVFLKRVFPTPFMTLIDRREKASWLRNDIDGCHPLFLLPLPLPLDVS